MIKNEKIAASRALQIIINNFDTETAEDIIANNVRSCIPIIVNKYLPLDNYEATVDSLFTKIVKVLQEGKFKDSKSTTELFVTTAIGFAGSESASNLILKWFMSGEYTDLSGAQLPNVEMTMKQKHSIVQKIYASKCISLESK